MGCIIKVLSGSNGFRLWKVLKPRLDFSIGCVVLLAMGLSLQEVRADHLRTQTIDLEAGWNAIFLEVNPVDSNPAILFADTSVDMVSAYDGATFTKQFSTDPEADMGKLLGWGTWYAPEREDAFLSDLRAIYGNKAYLVHATESTSLSIEGTVLFQKKEWKSDDYTLVGYSLDRQSPPTFAAFFAGSAAHKGQSIYRLKGGLWKKVIDPANASMKSGEAFWVYCDGPSSYQGPVEIVPETGNYVVIGQNQISNLRIWNRSEFPLQIRAAHQTSEAVEVSLGIMISVIQTTSMDEAVVEPGIGSWEIELASLEAGQGIKLPLSIATEKMNTAKAESLLCIKSDLGTETWIAIQASRGDLK